MGGGANPQAPKPWEALGLSPRGRGSRYPRPRVTLTLGSIPAWAGEPGPNPKTRHVSEVYPRVGGGAA